MGEDLVKTNFVIIVQKEHSQGFLNLLKNVKAFDQLSHTIIVQALRAFGIPELLIQAL
jgi:hypothetical protein